MIRYNRQSSIVSWTCLCGLALSWLGLSGSACAQVRIKDLTTIEGVRTNQLTGVGLVTGLNGTGGTSPITREFAANLVQRFGVRIGPVGRLTIPTNTKQRTDNVSVVLVTADLPVFAKPGSRIDVTVSTYDDAESIQGGVLVLTPLEGADGLVYAVASGPVSVGGGFTFGGDAATVQKNHPTTGRIPNGATVERVVPIPEFAACGHIRLLLRQDDFSNAVSQIALAINQFFPGTASAVDAGTVRVLVPPDYQFDHISFISDVRSITVHPDVNAKVVINERTGTLIVGEHVRISPVAITHANLAVTTGETPEVAQPAPFSRGVTAVVPRTQLDVIEDRQPMHVIPGTSTVGDLAAALNVLGVTPRDLSAIFQQLSAAGALHAEVKIQ